MEETQGVDHYYEIIRREKLMEFDYRYHEAMAEAAQIWANMHWQMALTEPKPPIQVYYEHKVAAKGYEKEKEHHKKMIELIKAWGGLSTVGVLTLKQKSSLLWKYIDYLSDYFITVLKRDLCEFSREQKQEMLFHNAALIAILDPEMNFNPEEALILVQRIAFVPNKPSKEVMENESNGITAEHQRLATKRQADRAAEREKARKEKERLVREKEERERQQKDTLEKEERRKKQEEDRRKTQVDGKRL